MACKLKLIELGLEANGLGAARWRSLHHESKVFQFGLHAIEIAAHSFQA